jgi:uncharacterized protein involved in cysteine biosynthesis
MIGFAKKFALGFLTPLAGMTLILESHRIRRLAILPFVLTLILFLVGLALGLPFITSLVAPFTKWIVSLFSVKATSNFAITLSWVLPILIWPALAVSLLYLLVVLTRLFVSPFYSLLSEKVLVVRGVLEPGRFQLFPWMRSNFRMLRVSLAKALAFVVVGLVLTVLSFIPGLGLFTAFGFMMLIAYDVTDYALEALQLGFPQRFDFFKRHFPAFIGLGAALGLVFLIPGLNFFLLPASVVGAAELVRRLDYERERSDDDR